ncbi:hypothetical protein LA76x_1115 [Lysobacter antibioticus]|uniref:Uncharacterized protein n=1 Tax=Lysobacter antibioticus TaxID=84531 RepID=A0A0S2F6X0_LYSAN|nr:hypothetical protein LA76x_1115 [Lysobacter antibioticus]
MRGVGPGLDARAAILGPRPRASGHPGAPADRSAVERTPEFKASLPDAEARCSSLTVT